MLIYLIKLHHATAQNGEYQGHCHGVDWDGHTQCPPPFYFLSHAVPETDVETPKNG